MCCRLLLARYFCGRVATGIVDLQIYFIVSRPVYCWFVLKLASTQATISAEVSCLTDVVHSLKNWNSARTITISHRQLAFGYKRLFRASRNFLSVQLPRGSQRRRWLL
ncbi:hypothetical protein AcV7_010244 [Taiwanofungus camphoratus]|nr:hypothetical protein AcV7_010244 [Antrodia cinnamomea]